MNNTGTIDSTRYTLLSIVPGVSSPNASAVLEINPFRAIDAATQFACCVETGIDLFISNSTSPTLAGNSNDRKLCIAIVPYHYLYC